MSFMPIQIATNDFWRLGFRTGSAYDAHCLIWFCSETVYGWWRGVLLRGQQWTWVKGVEEVQIGWYIRACKCKVPQLCFATWWKTRETPGEIFNPVRATSWGSYLITLSLNHIKLIARRSNTWFCTILFVRSCCGVKVKFCRSPTKEKFWSPAVPCT